jgi:hypothetical protein
MLCVVLLYTQVLIMLAQTVFCNQHHSIEQRLIRWLLWTIERVVSEQVLMTHEAIAHILGVRGHPAAGKVAGKRKTCRPSADNDHVRMIGMSGRRGHGYLLMRTLR